MTAADLTTSEARGRVRVERGAKRIRAYLGGELVADTTQPLLVWEKPYYPTYYFPAADVRTELLTEDGGVAHSPSRGDGRVFTVRAGGHEREGAAQRFDESPFEELRDTIRLDWNAIDACSRKTSRCSPIHAAPTRGSTPSPARGTFASRSTG